MTIRQARADDAPTLARLLVQVQDQHVREYPKVFRTIPIEDALAHATAEIMAGLCAVHESGVVDGMVKWMVQDRPETLHTHAARIAIIDQVVVDATARRKGIGRQLLAWVADRAREAGASRVQLDTWASNAPALAAFRAAGFAPWMHRQWRWIS